MRPLGLLPESNLMRGASENHGVPLMLTVRFEKDVVTLLVSQVGNAEA